jgi:hypothetical protein
MIRGTRLARVVLCLVAGAIASGAASVAAQPGDGTWKFAVSGDSRNCGDVVMPGIAASALKHKPEFYWHLGDFRAIHNFDEDIQHSPKHAGKSISIIEYLNSAWDDFIENQVEPFGSLPVFLGIGNHETVPPKTREEYISQFGDWLGAPAIKKQRLQDNPRDHRLRAYYHWVWNGVDFISLDNATSDQFDSAQVKWFERVIKRDAGNPDIKTVVVGMHAALPDSISAGHSMNESAVGEQSGRRVYQGLLKLQNESRKRVYLLASHSHYFMDGIFNTEYVRTHGGVLPGWIVGTAGAVRYALPENSKDARLAQTNVYGYLLAIVDRDGEIRFEFQRLAEEDTPADVVSRYKPEFVHWCFAENSAAH